MLEMYIIQNSAMGIIEVIVTHSQPAYHTLYTDSACKYGK